MAARMSAPSPLDSPRSDGSWSAFADTLIHFLQANVRLPALDGCVHADAGTSIVRFAAKRRDERDEPASRFQRR